MVPCKLLAFLLCEKATREPNGRVTLSGVFDRIIVPRSPVNPKIFFVYYKIIAEQPCTITLRVIDPLGHEIPGPWRDSIGQLGPMQSVWALITRLFKDPGQYQLELNQETDCSGVLSLATMPFLVDHEGE